MGAISNRSLQFFVFIILAGIAGAWLTHLHVNENVPLINSAREAALIEGRMIFADIATYPTAATRDELKEKEIAPGKGMWKGVKNVVLWEQEFETPGVKEELQKWFVEKLSPKGWKIWDPRDSSELHTQWCRPNWLLTIQHNVKFEHPPSSRFTLRLEWRWNFTEDRCPLPY